LIIKDFLSFFRAELYSLDSSDSFFMLELFESKL